MSEGSRALELAAYDLIRQEALRVVKGPPIPGEESWIPGWQDWDMVLAGDSVGVQPSLFAFKLAGHMGLDSLRDIYKELVRRVIASPQPTRSGGGPMGIRLVTVFLFDSIEPSTARKIAGLVPDRYYSGLKPEVWAVDLSRGKLWAPRMFGVIPSRAQSAMKRALDQLRSGAAIQPADLARAEYSVRKERADFVSRIRTSVPYVTYFLLAAIYAVFALEWLYSSGNIGNRALLHFGAMQPSLIQHRGEYWLLFTAMFVHVSVVHILFNSIALYSVGTLVERIYGHLRYAVIYLVSGLLASIASYVYMLVNGDLHDIAAGASGAIFGIAGVVIVLGILRQSVVPRAVAIQLSVFMLILIVMNIAFDAFSPQIDIRAHIGGLVVGVILGYVLAPRTPAAPTAELRAETEALG